MSASEPSAGRYRLPLFPLPVVLLPGARMPLHIFEQRYRDMVADAMRADRRFGMLYHDWDVQGPFLSDPGSIGCVARIVEFRGLEDGRSLIIVEGVARFAIDDGLESDALYFEALVRPYTDVGTPAAAAGALVTRRTASLALFERVLASMAAPPESLPDLEPDSELSFRLAQTIQVDPRWHQELLEMRSEEERLDRVDEVFRALLET